MGKINNKVDEYLVIDNFKRFIIKDFLCKQTCLEDVKLKDITRIANAVVGICSNLEYYHNENKNNIKNAISDDFNWEHNNKLQDILKSHIYKESKE